MTCIGRRQGVLRQIRSKAGFPFALFSLINELDQVRALANRAGLYRTFNHKFYKPYKSHYSQEE
jgi:hypothetical protein